MLVGDHKARVFRMLILGVDYTVYSVSAVQLPFLWLRLCRRRGCGIDSAIRGLRGIRDMKRRTGVICRLDELLELTGSCS